MDILSYILSKKNNGSSTGGSGGTGGSGSSSASVVVEGGGAVVDPAQTYRKLYFNTELSNEEVMALMNNLELNFQGMGNLLYFTSQSDMIMAMIVADHDVYILASGSKGILFAINGNLIEESITFTGWNPDIDFSNGIEMNGNTIGTELPTDQGPMLIGANNDKIVELFSSEPIKKAVNKGLSGVYDGNDIEVGSTHIDVSSLLDENKLPLNIDVVDNNLVPGNIIKDTTIFGVTGTYSGIIPRGTINITSTKPVDVTNYVSAKVVDSNLVAGNIARNKTILGILGTYTGNDDTSIEDSLITRKVTTYGNDRVTSIGQNAFKDCKSLRTINCSNVTSIEKSAFEGCSSLTSINFPLITSIGLYAFKDCNNLWNVNCPNVTTIGQYAFQNCNLANADFPLITAIEPNTFLRCRNLRTINCPNVTTIGGSAFEGCSSLTNADFPQVTHIGSSAFSGNTRLTNASFPKATSIRSGAFSNCWALTAIDCSNVTNIDGIAFGKCCSLIKVFISQTDQVCTFSGASDSFLKENFYDCYHIVGVKDPEYNPDGLKDGYIYAPASLLSQYKVARIWAAYASQIIGHENLEAGATLPNYTTDTFTTQTWYSDERLTTVVTEVATTGKYYCRLEA